jgi:hypothetical protein
VKVASLIASRNRPDLVEAMVAELRSHTTIENDIYVVECGSDADKLSPHTSLWYPDPDFRGKCFGHDLALELARRSGDYDYFFVLMNDLDFGGADVVATLVETLEQNERMAILSPFNVEGGYPGADAEHGGDWRAVTTCDYLALMMRAQAVDEVGSLNPDFRYCWGAIHELSYKLYRAGWFMAYSDRVGYRHLGGSTYGAPGTSTISRDDYQHEAKLFAARYLREHYGADWDERFWQAAQGHGIETNTFALHRALWETAEEPPVRLHLGSGREYREGWVNVDVDPEREPDLVSRAESLAAIESDTVAEIEACHLLEHLTYDDALGALREWHRVLAPGGTLALELPDVGRCFAEVGNHLGPTGHDLALMGVYGSPQAIAESTWQAHKWGWTPETLGAELRGAGFVGVEPVPVAQTWRPAAQAGLTMRVRARKPAGLREGAPDFVGVGAMKAGTTRWFKLIGDHPGVHCPDPWRKELHFFDDLAEGADLREYHRLFPRPEGLLAGEWTPSYMFLPRIPAQLAAAAPDANLLVILRDPVERYRSGITHSANAWGSLNDGWLRMHREIGFYGEQLARLLEHFPREQILVLQHERCAADPVGELARTYRFLGLDDSFVPPGVHEHVHRTDGEKLPLPEASRRALAHAYREDALLAAGLFPELDLSLWPSLGL